MTTLNDAPAQVETAFAEAPRPPDAALLHPACLDDNDIASLYGVAHWRDLPDQAIEYEYAALFFLSPEGFRHFLPAYLGYALRHPDSGAAAVDATIYALTPAQGSLREFSLSKYGVLDERQRAAVTAFLQAMAPHADVQAALAYWEGRPPDATTASAG